MAIVVPCPHCGTRVNLPADLNGKQTQCPNLGCRKAFVVKGLQEKAPPEPDMFELPPEPAPEPPPPPPKPKAPKPVAAQKPAQPKPPKPKPAPLPPAEEEVVEASVVSGPKVKEVVWSDGTDVPPPPPAETKKKPKPAKEDDDDDLPVRRKKKKGNRRPLILAGMAIVALGLVIFAIIYALGVSAKKEEQLAGKAKEHYEKGEYLEATKGFEALAKEYPDAKKVDEYKFFAALAQMQSATRSVTNRDDYESGVKKLNEFIAAHKDDPLAKPTSGFGRDVLEAGKKLGEDIGNNAADRVKAYQGDRAGKVAELARAEKAIAAGRALLPTLEPFRGPDDGPPTRVTELLEAAEKSVKREKDRTAALDRARSQLENPTDAVIQTAIADLDQAGFLEDAEAQALIAAAKGRLRELVKYEPDAAEPQPAPPTAAASLLFVTPVGKDKLRTADPNDPPPGAFLCVARGILYALDEDTGALLWAARVGPDVTDPPAVARVQLAGGLTDLAVVVSNVGNAPALTGQVLRTGAVRWYQPLPAPAAGPPIVIGARAFVPLRDAVGTVYEFDLSTGARLGKIRLGQPVAERGAVLRPGTNLLYVPADARRLYVIDAGGKDDDGNRVNPRCAQAIATGHVAGSLRVSPVFVGPDGLEDAQRFVILCLADGTSRTQVRAYPVTAIAPAGAGGAVAETTAVPVASLPVPGWVAFPPVSDGERLALVTDTGHVRLFGVNQPGNADKPLFALPAPPALGSADRPTPGLLVPVEEATYWAVAGGQLQKARLSLVTAKGQEVVFAGTPVPAGEPVHGAQVNARRDTACVVVRALASSGVRAIAFDARTGDVRWQRQLGLVPAKGHSPVAQGSAFVIVDEEGSAVAVPAESGATAGQSVPAKPAWVLGAPPAGATGPTVVAVGANGKVVFAVTPVTRDVPKFVVRRIENGKLVYESETAAQSPMAGAPSVVGDALLIPTADGFVNRFVPGDGRVRPGSLTPGPGWRTDRRAESVCAITPLSDVAFATSDGGKRISRWEWPAAANARWSLSTAWELRQECAGAGVSVSPEGDGPPRVLFADTSGGVWSFAADRAGAPLRRWNTGEALPAGKPSALVRNLDATKPAVALVLDGKTVVSLDPNRKDALWPTPPNDLAVVGAPQALAGNRWIVTDLTGRVLVLDGATGGVVETKSVGLPGAVPASAVGASAEQALAPLTDGSVVVIELPK